MNIIFTPCWLKFGVAAKDYTQQFIGCGGRRTTPLKSTSQIHNGMLTHESRSSTAPRIEGKGE
ncbi:hypothetical protein BGV45_08085 [Serratia marcescens]|nr:hypothetical protein RN42_17715 [Serratia marcescens]OHT35495.1 hypothetical protein BGV45_08085 [Serratia marcescens]